MFIHLNFQLLIELHKSLAEKKYPDKILFFKKCTDQLKTITDQIGQIPGTSSGTEVYVYTFEFSIVDFFFYRITFSHINYRSYYHSYLYERKIATIRYILE